MHNQNQGQMRSFVRPTLTRPRWISEEAGQIVLLVRDASGSMFGNKAEAAEAASTELCHELGKPENKDGFWAALVDFAGDARTVHDLDSARALCEANLTLDHSCLSGGTSLGSGLQHALEIIEKAGRNPPTTRSMLRPVCLIFTDGQNNGGPDPMETASQVKAQADLVTVAFGRDADEALLGRMASSSEHFFHCRNGKELRRFMAQVGATVAATRARGTNATQALTQIRQ